MPALIEEDDFQEEIAGWDTTTVAHGGQMNAPLSALASRTRRLKNITQEHADQLGGIVQELSQTSRAIIWDLNESVESTPPALSDPVITLPFDLEQTISDDTVTVELDDEGYSSGGAFVTQLPAEKRVWMLWRANSPTGPIESGRPSGALVVGNPTTDPDAFGIAIINDQLFNMVTSSVIDAGTGDGDWILIEFDTREASPSVVVHTTNDSYPISSDQIAGRPIHIGVFDSRSVEGVIQASSMVSFSEEDLGVLVPTNEFEPLSILTAVLPETAGFGTVLKVIGQAPFQDRLLNHGDVYLLVGIDDGIADLLSLRSSGSEEQLSITVRVPEDVATLPEAIEVLANLTWPGNASGHVIITSGHTLTIADRLELRNCHYPWLHISASAASVPVLVDATGVSGAFFSIAGSTLGSFSGIYEYSGGGERMPLEVIRSTVQTVGRMDGSDFIPLTFRDWPRASYLDLDGSLVAIDDNVDLSITTTAVLVCVGRGPLSAYRTNAPVVEVGCGLSSVTKYGPGLTKIRMNSGAATQLLVEDGSITVDFFGLIGNRAPKSSHLQVIPAGELSNVVIGDPLSGSAPVAVYGVDMVASLALPVGTVWKPAAGVPFVSNEGLLTVQGNIGIDDSEVTPGNLVAAGRGSITRWLGVPPVGYTGDFAIDTLDSEPIVPNIMSSYGTLVVAPVLPAANPHADLLARIEALENP